jgi:hypothetical protein
MVKMSSGVKRTWVLTTKPRNANNSMSKVIAYTAIDVNSNTKIHPQKHPLPQSPQQTVVGNHQTIITEKGFKFS